MDHYLSRVRGTVQLLQQQDIIGRTSELARVFGIQFFHVLTRGSQVPTHTLIGPNWSARPSVKFVFMFHYYVKGIVWTYMRH